MDPWDRLQEPDPNELLLRGKLINLCEIHSRKMSDEARGHWMRRLMQMHKTYGGGLLKALDAAADSRTYMELGWIEERAQQFNRRDVAPYVPPPPPTTEEQLRSDHAAILSMLWLEYTKGFGPVHIGGVVAGCMSRIYAKQFGKTDAEIEEAMAAARAKYPREYVLQWMEDQKRKGN